MQNNHLPLTSLDMTHWNIIWDLHFHDTTSDATVTPAERLAQMGRLDGWKKWLWAATNHDRYTREFVIPAREQWFQAHWATEISSHSDELGLSFHITAYSAGISRAIEAILQGVLVWRRWKVLWQLQRLRDNGFTIADKEFFAWIESRRMSADSATNYHIAQYLWTHRDNIQRAHSLTDGAVSSEILFMNECLRKEGDYREIGYYEVPCYEPEVHTIVPLAHREDIVLSVAHPNISFDKYLRKNHGATDKNIVKLFEEHIVPILTRLWLKNYEVNAIASHEWVECLLRVTKKVWWILTYGSDNHGAREANSKHGVFWVQNPYLSTEMTQPIQERLREFYPVKQY